MSDLKITSGVARFEGAIFSKWYAWATVEGGRHLDGPLRFLKIRAKADKRGLIAKLRRLPRTNEVPRFDS
jgi:hypothetical protein